MVDDGGKRAEEAPDPRAARAAIGEIALLATAATIFALGFPSLRFDDGMAEFAVDWMAPAGEVVLAHLALAIGAFVPILLGFYAVVLGGQLAHSEKETRTRRMLGFAAEVMMAALTPALLLVLIASVSAPANVGVLFVVLPVMGVTFFLAVQLGGFVVFGDAEKLAAAEQSRDWARAHLRTLTRRSRRPVWLVVTANAVAGAVIGFVAFLAGGSAYPVWPGLVLCSLVAVGLALVGALTVDRLRTAHDRPTKVLFSIVLASLYVGVTAAATQMFTLASPDLAGGLGLLTTIAIIGVSTFWPLDRAPLFLADWTLQGAAATSATHSVVHIHRRAVHEIRELTRGLPGPAGTSLE